LYTDLVNLPSTGSKHFILLGYGSFAEGDHIMLKLDTNAGLLALQGYSSEVFAMIGLPFCKRDEERRKVCLCREEVRNASKGERLWAQALKAKLISIISHEFVFQV
jgi:hypothetical protein